MSGLRSKWMCRLEAHKQLTGRRTTGKALPSAKYWSSSCARPPHSCTSCHALTAAASCMCPCPCATLLHFFHAIVAESVPEPRQPSPRQPRPRQPAPRPFGPTSTCGPGEPAGQGTPWATQGPPAWGAGARGAYQGRPCLDGGAEQGRLWLCRFVEGQQGLKLGLRQRLWQQEQQRWAWWRAM